MVTANRSVVVWDPGWAKGVEEPERGITKGQEEMLDIADAFTILIMTIPLWV